MTVEDAIKAIIKEYGEATNQFGKFNSAHEGWAVLKEEVDELWEEIKAKPRDHEGMHREAIQVGAMALRFLQDCC